MGCYIGMEVAFAIVGLWGLDMFKRREGVLKSWYRREGRECGGR